jgi:hypothetical protein
VNYSGLKHPSFQLPFQAAFFFDKPLVAPKALALSVLHEFADLSTLARSLSTFLCVPANSVPEFKIKLIALFRMTKAAL